VPFVCQKCQNEFNVSPAALAKYPGWVPKTCSRCKKAASPSGTREENLTTAEVLEKYTAGPLEGVFTDGAAEPNPGPGGWGAVYVVGGEIADERHGHEPHTTNNRMELSALIAGCRMVPKDRSAIIHTDSDLCVKSITIWAKDWEARGWKKKDKNAGEIKNLDLVQELFRLYYDHGGLRLQWIKAHAGNRWNEYADSLATSYRRQS
jgi:ribonuclease HI